MKNWFYFLIIGILIFINLKQCGQMKRDSDRSENSINFLEDSISEYINKNGNLISEKTALYGDKKELETILRNTKEDLREVVNELDEVRSAGQIEAEVEIDTVKITYKDTVPYKFKREWSLNNKWYNISGVSDQSSTTIHKLNLSTDLSFSAGFDNGEYKSKVKSSNPHVKIKDINIYNREKSKDKKIGFGIIGGYGLGSELKGSWFVGLGASYNLFKL